MFSRFKNVRSNLFSASILTISMLVLSTIFLSSCDNSSAKEAQQKKEEAEMKTFFAPHKMQKSYQTQMGDVQTERIPDGQKK
jgi:hypothetical protein